MGAKKRQMVECFGTPPATLKDHPFYGYEITDPEQIAYRDALWDRDVRMVLVDAVAGSGKTFAAVAIANMYVKYGICDEAFYIRTPSSEGRIGFLPGDQGSKEKPYMSPLYSALINIGENPFTAVNTEPMFGQANGTTFTAMSDVYILGSDYRKKFVIIDEAQCMTTEQLKAVITRFHDDCKVVICGSTRQIQGIPPEQSGFKRCIEHFSDREWARVCTLSKNYRGEMSAWADLL